MIKPTSKSIFLACIVLLISIGCKNEPPKEPVISTFYLIRHAEKDRTNPENKNPELNQDGLNRALKWAEVFDSVELDAIYSTNYERTMMTAAPASIKKEVEIKNYVPGAMDIDSFKKSHKGHSILIVGHSNSTPDFANKLLGEEKYPSMSENDNSSLFVVRFIDDTVTDLRLKID